ncbi:hypothetical protein T10_1895 [Trichinella papuae]|uniref:Uncharacterized protein n=1 Tax=Trichinella papuae TaxID=268474 RepID=A0A0V1LZ29_9BILA|nr:hypothetical protein T10_1895 [Trichinella papuae]
MSLVLPYLTSFNFSISKIIRNIHCFYLPTTCSTAASSRLQRFLKILGCVFD